MKEKYKITKCSCGEQPKWVKGQNTVMLRCCACGKEGICVSFSLWRKAVEKWNKMNGGVV